MDDVKLTATALTLFGKKEATPAPPAEQAKFHFAANWRKVGLMSRASDILKDLEVLSRVGMDEHMEVQ